MVGCGPGLYVTAKEVYRTRAARTYGTGPSGSGNGKKWYGKDRSYNEVESGKDTQGPHPGGPRHIPLEEMTDMRHKRKDSDEPFVSPKTWVEIESTHTHGSDASVPDVGNVERRGWPLDPKNQFRGGTWYTP